MTTVHRFLVVDDYDSALMEFRRGVEFVELTIGQTIGETIGENKKKKNSVVSSSTSLSSVSDCTSFFSIRLHRLIDFT